MKIRKNILSFIAVLMTVVYSFGFVSGIFPQGNHASCGMTCSMDNADAIDCCCEMDDHNDQMTTDTCSLDDINCSCKTEELASSAVVPVNKNEFAKNILPDTNIKINQKHSSESGVKYSIYSHSPQAQSLFIINSSLLI